MRLPLRPNKFSSQKGYLTIVQNNSTTDYLRLAYLQALSIKATQQTYRDYAIVVDAATRSQITGEHLQVFDHVIDIPDKDLAADQEWKLANEWKVWWATPFKETVKLDADIIFTGSVDHWWPIMQTRDVCLCTTVVDWEGNRVSQSPYREMQRRNNLPEVYSAFSYFRYTQTSADFYSWCARIYTYWPLFRDRILFECNEESPTTDTVYALASQMVGEEHCTLPSVAVPAFAHMKGGIQGWDLDTDWTKILHYQINDRAESSIGTVRQRYPIHYHIKDFATEELIGRFRRIAEGLGRIPAATSS